LNNKNGTAADLNGQVTLPNNSIGDTLKVSFIGYQDEIIVIDQFTPKTIELKIQSNIL